MPVSYGAPKEVFPQAGPTCYRQSPMNDRRNTTFATSLLVNDQDLARAAHALAHPARIRIVRLLAAQTECRGADVFSELPLAQSTISEHLRVLKDAGLVQSHPVGTGMVYCLVPTALDDFHRAVGDLTADAPSCTTDKKGC